ncbi:hypothetical protein [Streptomyces kronopolitis]|uniref:hypothetical protein n=1 Tax=Streptomyces kronopolitis TaxID=1612435 RepID=UPI003D954D97
MKGTPLVCSDRSRRPNPAGCLAIGAVVIAFVALFAVVLSGGDDDSPPRCPVSRSGAVTGTGTHHQGGDRSATTKKPGGTTNGKSPTGKQPGAKAPAARPKAPAAPAPRPPSIRKR